MAPIRYTRVLALLVVSLAALSGCATVQSLLGAAPKPTATIKGISFGDLSWDKIALNFEVEVHNPYDVPLPLVNLDYSMSAGTSRLLKGAAQTQGSIPAKGSKVLTLPAEVSLTDAMAFIKGVRPGTTIPYSTNATLLVNAPTAGQVPIPITRQGEIKVPSIPGL